MSPQKYTVEIEILEVPGFPGYGVSTYGTQAMLWSRWQRGGGSKLTNRWRAMCPFIVNSGYSAAKVRVDGEIVNVLLHRMVLLAYKGPGADGDEARHMDDLKGNNHPGNLEWGTRIQNMDDRDRNGKTLRGTGVGNSKLTEADVIEIRRLYSQGVHHKLIADMFNVCEANIRFICQGKTWRHLLPAAPAAAPEPAGLPLG